MPIILRFRSKQGMLRITVEPHQDFTFGLEQLVEKLGDVDPQTLHISKAPNTKGEPVNGLCGRTVEELGLKNGEMLFVSYESNSIETDNEPPSTTTNPNNGSVKINPVSISSVSGPLKVEQLPVDEVLSKSDGLIKRPMGKYCRHGSKGMCEYCSPLPPWDANYRKENNIKHMSFHAYVKELNDSKNNRNNASSYIAPLEEPNFKIDLNCSNGHKPYPKGICSKCQPSAITLSQQKFRMVDHVEFADSGILNSFIEAWRQTGVQRYGVLYGTYQPFEKVPLGIKAVVEAIYEPPQAGEADGITLLPWDNQDQVDKIAQSLGMYQVGITFTDLTDSGSKNGTVLCKRHKDSYFMSNLEILMAARNQKSHPSATPYSPSGKFSSKFVTCVISGGLEGQIEPRSYQVSVGAEALVEAEIITASTQPSKLYVNSSNDTRYVPDIAYSQINEYGLEVKYNAKPTFPVDFLLVSLSDSFPMEPKPFFINNNPFTIENRDFMGELQNFPKLNQYLNADTSGSGAQMRDFHFLTYVAKTAVLAPAEFELLLKFVKDGEYSDYLQLVESPGWMTLLTIAEQSS